MQLKQFYNSATKVSSKKSATTFGDLPDCLSTYMCEGFLLYSGRKVTQCYNKIQLFHASKKSIIIAVRLKHGSVIWYFGNMGKLLNYVQ